MNRIFFDTEFLSEPPELHLISIGMVDENGREFYGIRKEAPWSRINSHAWLSKNVVPHLPNSDSSEWMTDEELRQGIVDFCGYNPEFWAYVAAYDWTVLTGLFGQFTDLPHSWPYYVNDIKWLSKGLNVKRIPTNNPNEHDALSDAREVKDAYEWCMKQERF
jgi:hypothetical protein